MLEKRMTAEWYREQADACEKLAEVFRYLEGRNCQFSGVLLDHAGWLRSAARKSQARELEEMGRAEGES